MAKTRIVFGWVALAAAGCISSGGTTADADADAGAGGATVGGAGGEAAGGQVAGGAGGAGGATTHGPHLEASAALIAVMPGNPQTLTITNTGDATATLTQFVQTGSASIAVLLQGLDPRRAGDALADPDADGTPGLSPGAHVDLEIRVPAPDAERDVAVLRFLSADEPPLEVTVTDFNPQTCLAAEPGALEWQTRIGAREAQSLTLTPCLPGATVTVNDVKFSGPNADVFRLAPDSPPAPWTIDAPTEVRVEFLPVAAGPAEASLDLGFAADGPVDEVQSIALRGIARENQCPQAWPAQTSFQVPWGTVIALDGAASVDPDGPDGRPVTYEWLVLERPEGSTSMPRESLPGGGPDGPPDDSRTPAAAFFVDMAGRYTLELRVTDEQGLSNDACDAADDRIVVIDSRPRPEVEVLLEYGPVEGADLDLHLKHPNGDWFIAPGDCYYGNPTPDWGFLGDRSDDPNLLTDAPGEPERLLLARPENTEDLGSPYTVGVHGYDVPQGVSVPFTVTIRVNDEIAYTSPPEVMVAQNGFCIIAGIDWPAGTVTPSVECGPSRP